MAKLSKNILQTGMRAILRERERKEAAAKEGPMRNVAQPPIPIKHADLKRSSTTSGFKSDCPVCVTGVLAVTRDATTLMLRREDRCLQCGQEFIYTDVAINNEVLPAMRQSEG